MSRQGDQRALAYLKLESDPGRKNIVAIGVSGRLNTSAAITNRIWRSQKYRPCIPPHSWRPLYCLAMPLAACALRAGCTGLQRQPGPARPAGRRPLRAVSSCECTGADPHSQQAHKCILRELKSGPDRPSHSASVTNNARCWASSPSPGLHCASIGTHAPHAANGVTAADTQLMELLNNVANGVLTASDAAVQLNQASAAAAMCAHCRRCKRNRPRPPPTTPGGVAQDQC